MSRPTLNEQRKPDESVSNQIPHHEEPSEQASDSIDKSIHILPFFSPDKSASSKRQSNQFKTQSIQELSAFKSGDIEYTSADDSEEKDNQKNKMNMSSKSRTNNKEEEVGLELHVANQGKNNRMATVHPLNTQQQQPMSATIINNLLAVPQETTSLRQSQHQREISRTLSARDAHSQKQPNNSDSQLEQAHQQQQPQGSLLLKPLKSVQMGPQLFLNTDSLGTEVLHPQPLSHANLQSQPDTEPIAQLSNQQLIQQQRQQQQSAQVQQAQSHQASVQQPPQGDPDAPQSEDENPPANNVVVINENVHEVDYPNMIGFLQHRHMSRVLKYTIVLFIVSAVYNTLVTAFSILGIIEAVVAKNDECYAAHLSTLIFMIIICALSLEVCLLDAIGAFLLKQYEYKPLQKNEWNRMRLKITDLQNCNSIFRGIFDKFPLILKPQIFIKSIECIIAILSFAETLDFNEDQPAECYQESFGHNLKGNMAIALIVLSNMSIYLLIGLSLLCNKLFLRVAAWKKKRDAQSLRNIKNSSFFKYKNESQLGKCDPTCIICYMDYEVDEDLAKLPCAASHIFHKQCVSYWLEINQCCPICKQTI